MRYKYVLERLREMGGKTMKEASIEEKAIIESLQDEVFVSKSIAEEIVVLNDTSGRIATYLSSIKWILAVIGFLVAIGIYR